MVEMGLQRMTSSPRYSISIGSGQFGSLQKTSLGGLTLRCPHSLCTLGFQRNSRSQTMRMALALNPS